MVRIRLKRIGQRNRPSYRIVVTEKSRAREGKYIESLGHYNPRDKALVIDLERANHWLSKGAQPSDTAGRLIRRFTKMASSPATAPVPTEPTQQVMTPTTETPAESPAEPSPKAAEGDTNEASG